MFKVLDFLKTMTFNEIVGTTEEGVLHIDYLGDGRYVGMITDFMLDMNFPVTEEGALVKVRRELLLIPYNSKNKDISEYRFKQMKDRIPPLHKLRFSLAIHDNRYPLKQYNPKEFLKKTPKSYTGESSFYVNRIVNIPFVDKSVWRIAHVEFNEKALDDITRLFCDLEEVTPYKGRKKYIARRKDGRYIGSLEFAMKLYKEGIWPFASVGRDSKRLDIGRKPHNGKYCGWITENCIRCFDTEAEAAQYVVNGHIERGGIIC